MQETHSIYGFVLNDIHCTSCDCCYFKLSYLTGMLKNEPVQTLHGYLSDMIETATLFLCTLSLDFTVLEFLYLFSISISLLFHLENIQIDNKYVHERKLKMYHNSTLAEVIRQDKYM